MGRRRYTDSPGLHESPRIAGTYPSSAYDDTLEAGVPRDMDGEADDERDETLRASVRPGTESADGGDMERSRG